MQYKLKESRIKAGYTQEEAAWKAGISCKMISRYENEQSDPTLKVAAALAILYNVSLDYLAGISDEEKPLF